MTTKVHGTLVGVNGNAFSLMGHFSRLAKEQGHQKDWIDDVCKEAMSGDYNHLISTLTSHMDMDGGDDE